MFSSVSYWSPVAVSSLWTELQQDSHTFHQFPYEKKRKEKKTTIQVELKFSMFAMTEVRCPTKIRRTSVYLPACPLPCMLLSRGNMSEHFSRSTWPVRQSSVTICRALWHKVMLSPVRTLMSLLLSHCTPEEPGGRGFI